MNCVEYMYTRIFKPQNKSSYFLFGPRGSGKSCWLRTHYKKSNYIDLLDAEIYNDLIAEPKNLSKYIKDSKYPIIIDPLTSVEMAD